MVKINASKGLQFNTPCILGGGGFERKNTKVESDVQNKENSQ